jgi:2-dehydropantoate 2-reductase
MKGIENALIVGAGAVGSAFADAIAERDPSAVRVLASADRLERYRSQGFIINGRRRRFLLVTPDDSAPARGGGAPADLILVAVKNHHMPEAIRDMRGFVGPSTLILSLLNGISSEEELAAAFGAEKVPYAVVIGIDAVREGTSTRFTSTGNIHFGDAANPPGAWSERVSRIAEFFTRTCVPFVVPADMLKTLWFKFMINVGINQASAVMREPYGTFQTDPHAQAVMNAAMEEVVALSKASGTGLESVDIAAWYSVLAGLGADGKTSMLQDVEAGRVTEVEAFAGTVMRLGSSKGVPVPVNTLFYHIVKSLERKCSKTS